MSETGPRSYLVRFFEAGRDGQPGRQGQRRDLVGAIETELPGARVEAIACGRIAVACDQDASAALAGLPGITSFSPCRKVDPTEIARSAVDLAAARLPPGGSFAVKVVRRRGEARSGPAAPHPPHRSGELAAAIGEAIQEAVPGSRVDLAQPDLAIGVELRGDECFLYHEVVPGVDRRPTEAKPATGEPRFLADQMLGRLAVWMRLCGFDTAEWRDRPDSWLLRRARDEGRVLLTRDRALSLSGSAATYFVEARAAGEQLVEVARVFRLRTDRGRLLSRCTRCNCLIEPVSLESVASRIPPAVRERRRDFTCCPSCGRVYWEGDHCRRILAHLSRLCPELGQDLRTRTCIDEMCRRS